MSLLTIIYVPVTSTFTSDNIKFKVCYPISLKNTKFSRKFPKKPKNFRHASRDDGGGSGFAGQGGFPEFSTTWGFWSLFPPCTSLILLF